MSAREPLDLDAVAADLDEVRRNVDHADAQHNPHALTALRVAEKLDAEVRDLRGKRDRRHLLGIVDRLRAERDVLAARLDAIRVLHTDSPAGVCPTCGRISDVSDTDDGLVDYPCPTLRAMGIEDAGPSRPGPLAGYTVRPLPPVPACPNCPPGYDCERGHYATTTDNPAPVLPERTAVPGEALPPIPDSAYAPGTIPVGRAIIVDPDNPEAVERELRRVAAETGEPYEIRDLYDAMVACGEEHLIERQQHELDQTEFVTLDDADRRWWVLRGPSGAVSLTAAVVPADAKLPPLSTAMMVRALDGAALFPDCFTAHRPGTSPCPALPGGCAADGGAVGASGAARKTLTDWAASGHDDDVIRDVLVDVYQRELLPSAPCNSCGRPAAGCSWSQNPTAGRGDCCTDCNHGGESGA